MRIIIFKIQVILKGRERWHRYDTGNMKFINKRKERKGCTTFTTRIASKSKTLRLKQSKAISRQNPRASISLGRTLAPWKLKCVLGMLSQAELR